MNRAAKIALAPLSGIYGSFVRAGNALYRRKVFRVHQVDAPVISVGNLTTGGTGKTPLVAWIANWAAQSGRRVCVLTRGYRRESSGRVVVSDGSEILVDVNQAGDEALLLAEELKGDAAVICDADRVAAAQWAIENLGSNLFVLDDGFQHQRIARNLNVLTIDATNPWGNGFLLPAGTLREPRQALSRADCVVITRAEDSRRLDELQKEIETIRPGVQVFSSRMKLNRLRPLVEPTQLIDIESIRTAPVDAFCAIGNPESFFNLLRRNDYQLGQTRSFRDHHKYSQSDVDQIERQARGARAILTTAKDAVKLCSLRFSMPCLVAEIDIEIDRADKFRELITKAIN